ncbi:nuclear pore complex protein Nup160 [Aplysia californica]|uniref:Nuclear pore complex protein Nup160 n=1 Tax=Aplysia californica TaxID=6500 RepID=A0ABM1W4Z9_APLCA|nr:nuclear pore complex protein Nup160 [Aplysia californica]
MAGMRQKTAMFREINVYSSTTLRWKSISICTGASASTLQDIKVPENCGGYSYIDSGLAGSNVRNRFIYWRTYQDVLELVEESLDATLSGNMVRYRFQDTPVLPNVTIHEIHGNVVILIATVASVHRLIFPHPRKLNRQHNYVLSEQNAASIFYNAALPDDPKNQFLLTPGGSITSHFLGSSSCVCQDDHAVFTLATNTGGILVIKMPPVGVAGVVIQQELSCASVMKKLWNGLIPGSMRSGQQVSETVLSLQLIPVEDDIYIFSVCKDARLRVWSIKTRDCVLVENLMDYTCEELEDVDTPVVANASGHVIKTILGSATSDLCVYLSLQQKAQFIFLTPELENGRLVLRHVRTMERAPPDDLVDFSVTDDFLMSLWTTQAGETLVLTSSLSQTEMLSEGDWLPVHLAPSSDFLVVPQSRDAREVYVERIFSPKLFAPSDIVKALSVYRRCPAPTVELETLYNLNSLKEEVIGAVDAEIRNLVSEDEVQEEAYTKLEQEQWEKFYSCCHQYKQVGEKAKGLFADPVTGLFGMIKKSTFSLLRPCDRTEELYLSPSLRLPVSFIDRLGLSPDVVSARQFSEDIRLLCDCIQLIADHTPAEAACLQTGLSDTLLRQFTEMMTDMIVMDREVKQTLATKLSSLASPVAAVETLFTLLEVYVDPDLEFMETADHAGHRQHCSHLFSGALGVHVLTSSFQQLSSLRFQFVRDLTVLLAAIPRLEEETGLTQQMRDTMRSELLPKGEYLLRCYRLLGWACEVLSAENTNSSLDYNLRQLGTLEIIDSGSSRMLARPTSQVSYLSQLFIEGVGGDQARHRLAAVTSGGRAVWKDDLGQVLNILCHIVWPATDETIFPEFLIRSCQYLRLQEYVHLLSPWCTWNESSRAFFLGLSYLHFDETHKAMKLFVEASDGIATETFLSQKLLQSEETDHYTLQILYYLKVIKLLEEKGLSDLVITMATEAIRKADPEDPNLPTLQSKVFKEHLKLGHCEASFHAMMDNPDPERRKDCLRQFLVVLCESGHLAELVGFDYMDLSEEVVYILENRARSVDLFTHDYYSLLFSYFIQREDYRAAGRVMLERGMRLAQEVPGLKSLQQQAQCYLAALNTLHLVKPENAWMVRPTRRATAQHRHDAEPPAKRDAEGEAKPSEAGPQKMEILELADLRKEYLLVDCRLRLIRHQPDTALVSGPMPSPEEILTLLCAAGLYDLAISLIHAFSLSPEPLLSSLALRCVTFSLSSSVYSKLTGDFKM